ncbi:MAG: hypothetical protein IJC43_08430, partial [Clostridia bacterium]|nr:hypothetical protein [Clostridia bacterium]
PPRPTPSPQPASSTLGSLWHLRRVALLHLFLCLVMLVTGSLMLAQVLGAAYFSSRLFSWLEFALLVAIACDFIWCTEISMGIFDITQYPMTLVILVMSLFHMQRPLVSNLFLGLCVLKGAVEGLRILLSGLVRWPTAVLAVLLIFAVTGWLFYNEGFAFLGLEQRLTLEVGQSVDLASLTDRPLPSPRMWESSDPNIVFLTDDGRAVASGIPEPGKTLKAMLHFKEDALTHVWVPVTVRDSWRITYQDQSLTYSDEDAGIQKKPVWHATFREALPGCSEMTVVIPWYGIDKEVSDEKWQGSRRQILLMGKNTAGEWSRLGEPMRLETGADPAVQHFVFPPTDLTAVLPVILDETSLVTEYSILDIVHQGLLGSTVETWGPERELLTRRETAEEPAFNVVRNHETLGDTRNFVRIREVGDEHWLNQVTLRAGGRYEVEIFFHNAADPSLNESEEGVVVDSRLFVTLPDAVDPMTASRIKGLITATPVHQGRAIRVWDTAVLRAEQPVNLRFVEGSAALHCGGTADGLELAPEALFSTGATLSYWDHLPGLLPGGDEYAGSVTFRFVAEAA